MKKNLLQLNVIVIVFLIVTGCTKREKDPITGRVAEVGTFEPIEGATVELQFWDPSPRKSRLPYNFVSTVTNSEGEFSFSEKIKADWRCVLRCTHKDHFSGIDVEPANNKPSLLTMNPFAFIKFRISKISDDASTIDVRLTGKTICTFTQSNHFDTLINTVTAVPAGNIQNISWSTSDKVKPPSPQNPNKVSADVRVLKGDTLLYRITY